MITYDIARTDNDLYQILALQQKNLARALQPEEVQSQGFVTVEHTFDVLKAMNHTHPHIVARTHEQIIGYALVMSRDFANDVPILKPMFDNINSIYYKTELLKKSQYIVMGQVCIHKTYRGQGVFMGMYNKMKNSLKNKYNYIITEVAQSNTRSLRAHKKVGFENILEYPSPEGEDWIILLWDIK